MIDSEKTRHAAYDALNLEQFDRLYAATFDSSDDLETELEDRFITVGSGRETLRKGALLHFRPSWLDREEKMIEVPAHQDCDCRYCREQAEQYAKYHEDVSFEEALDLMWSPKTEASTRRIYYGWSPRTIATIEAFADQVGELDMTASTINRRVDKLAERAGIDNLYPHALRATAAMFWSRLGLEPHYLQAMMGWTSLDVAVAYLRATGTQLGRRIERAFATTTIDRPDPVPEEDLIPPSDGVTEAITDGGFVPTSNSTLDEWTADAD